MKKSRYDITQTPASRIGKTIATAFLLVYTSIAVLLIFNTVMNSVKTQSDLVKNTVGFPKSFTLSNYLTVILEDKFWLYFLNSIVLSVCGVGLLLFISSLTAYGLSRFKFKSRELLQNYFLVGLMFPIQLGVLPLFIILKNLGLMNNLFGLILLYASNMSFAVFVCSKFFRTLPVALSESAKIDGASEFVTYARIIMPVSLPVLSTVGLINFITIWNDFYMPLVFLTKANVRTLTLAVYRYMSNFLANWHLVFAAVTIALVPVIIVFFLFSNQIVAGLTGGAVKE